MWSKKRGIEDFMFMAILPIGINIATNSVYFISGGSYEILTVVDELNFFTIFGVLFSFIFNFFTEARKLSEEEEKELNKKMFGMKLLNIFFIGYIIFTIFIMKNGSIIASSLIMFAGYINLYMFKSKSIGVGSLSETQKNWKEFYNQPSCDDVNIFWKIKPMIHPHVSVSFSERISNINWIALLFIVPFFTNFTLKVMPMMLICSALLIWDILYFVDVILGLYTETEGTCTGVVMKEGSNSTRGRYYEVYVTDFSNKREIKFRVYGYCNYSQYDIVKLTHGGLSKKVIDANIVSKNF